MYTILLKRKKKDSSIVITKRKKGFYWMVLNFWTTRVTSAEPMARSKSTEARIQEHGIAMLRPRALLQLALKPSWIFILTILIKWTRRLKDDIVQRQKNKHTKSLWLAVTINTSTQGIAAQMWLNKNARRCPEHKMKKRDLLLCQRRVLFRDKMMKG